MRTWMRRRIERSRERCEKAETSDKSKAQAQKVKPERDRQTTQVSSAGGDS